jgi:hypothetical protein
MPRFMKKPVVIDAVQWLGSNTDDMSAHFGTPIWGGRELLIQTLEGEMRASIGDWIIKGVKGEFYPCKPDIFEATYAPADDDSDA